MLHAQDGKMVCCMCVCVCVCVDLLSSQLVTCLNGFSCWRMERGMLSTGRRYMYVPFCAISLFHSFQFLFCFFASFSLPVCVIMAVQLFLLLSLLFQPWEGDILGRRKSGSLMRQHFKLLPIRSISGLTTHHVTIQRLVSNHEFIAGMNSPKLSGEWKCTQNCTSRVSLQSLMVNAALVWRVSFSFVLGAFHGIAYC